MLTAGAKADVAANAKVTANIAPIKTPPTASADLTTAATLLVQLVNNLTIATNAPLNQFVAGVADKRTVTATLFANLDATIVSTLATYGNMGALIDGIGAVISMTVTGNFTAAVATLQTEMGNLQTTFAALGSSIGSLESFTAITANRLITTDVQNKFSDSYANILAAIVQLEITTKNAVTIIVSSNTLTASVNTAGTNTEKTRATANATIIPAMNKLIVATATTLNAVGPMVKSAYDKVIAKIQVFATDTVVSSAATSISTIQQFEMDGAAAASTINATIAAALTTEIQVLTDGYTTNTVAVINATTVTAVNQIISDVKMGTANASICANKVIPKILALEATAIMKASACLGSAIMQLNTDSMATLAAFKILQASAISPSVSLTICTSYATSASAALPAKLLLNACLQGVSQTKLKGLSVVIIVFLQFLGNKCLLSVDDRSPSIGNQEYRGQYCRESIHQR